MKYTLDPVIDNTAIVTYTAHWIINTKISGTNKSLNVIATTTNINIIVRIVM